MSTADRRAEIINILLVRRRITAKELADEFHVTVRTIQNDIQALSLGFPIYTKQGGDGGIFVGEDYTPYMNTLTPLELKVLQEMYELAEGIHYLQTSCCTPAEVMRYNKAVENHICSFMQYRVGIHSINSFKAVLAIESVLDIETIQSFYWY